MKLEYLAIIHHTSVLDSIQFVQWYIKIVSYYSLPSNMWSATIWCLLLLLPLSCCHDSVRGKIMLACIKLYKSTNH